MELVLGCKRARATSVWLEAEHPSGAGGPKKQASSNFSRVDISCRMPSWRYASRSVLYTIYCIYYYAIFSTTMLYTYSIYYSTLLYTIYCIYYYAVFSTTMIYTYSIYYSTLLFTIYSINNNYTVCV